MRSLRIDLDKGVLPKLERLRRDIDLIEYEITQLALGGHSIPKSLETKRQALYRFLDWERENNKDFAPKNPAKL